MTDYLLLIPTFLTGIIASWVGSQVGGGGLIIIPYLIFIGLPPHMAIGTHRLGAFSGTFSSLSRYMKAGKVQWPYVLPLVALGVIGGVIGARILFTIGDEVLSKIIAFAILIPLPFLFIKKLGLERRKILRWIQGAGFLLYFLLSVWSGIFAAGAGILMLYLIATFFGFTFIESTATRKIPSLARGIVILIIFISAGAVSWHHGIPLVLGYLIGSWLGASYAIKKGNVWVRRLLILIVIASAIKLLFF